MLPVSCDVGVHHVHLSEMDLGYFETALPVKFAVTIRGALGKEPERPIAYRGLEALPQRCAVLPVDAGAVEAYIAEHACA